MLEIKKGKVIIMDIRKPKNINQFIENKTKEVTKETKSINIKLDKDFHKNLKVYCMLNDISMQEKITEILNNWAKNEPNFNKK